MPLLPGAVDTAGEQPGCEAPESVSFAWALAPVPEDISLDVRCTQMAVQVIADALTIELRCDEPGGEVMRTLTVWATPKPPRVGFEAGGAVRLRGFWLEQGGLAAEFVRLETEKGGLLVAGARGGGLAPADGSDLWLPFSLAAGAGTCMSEETACGMTERAAVELRRAGGAPRLVSDAQWSRVGDRGEAQVWVAAAQTGDATCVGAAGVYYEVGLMAAR